MHMRQHRQITVKDIYLEYSLVNIEDEKEMK